MKAGAARQSESPRERAIRPDVSEGLVDARGFRAAAPKPEAICGYSIAIFSFLIDGMLVQHHLRFIEQAPPAGSIRALRKKAFDSTASDLRRHASAQFRRPIEAQVPAQGR